MTATAIESTSAPDTCPAFDPWYRDAAMWWTTKASEDFRAGHHVSYADLLSYLGSASIEHGRRFFTASMSACSDIGPGTCTHT